MAIQHETPWTKTNQATKAIKPKSDNLEIPIGERLTKFRTEQQGDSMTNRFERRKAVETEIPLDEDVRLNAFDRASAKSGIEAPSRTQSYRIPEDTKLREARLAEEARRAALKNPPKQAATFSYSDADWAAILQGWKARHPEYIPTAHNGQNLGRMLAHQCAIGQLEWNSEGLTACHNWLAANDYYEPAEGQRKRGQPAPKVYPQYVPERPKADNSIVVKTYTTMTEEENASLRTKNFDQLAAEARSLNKKRTGK
jgi:hypothetical protein